MQYVEKDSEFAKLGLGQAGSGSSKKCGYLEKTAGGRSAMIKKLLKVMSNE